MKYFVYLVRVNGAVRYVGKGSGSRLQGHMQTVRRIARRRASGETVRTTKFYDKLTRAWLNGAVIEFEKLKENLSEAEAFRIEIFEISTRLNLWNLAPGGENPPIQTKRSEEFKRKVKASNLERWADPELRLEQAEAKKVHWLRPEYREAFSKSASHPSKAKKEAAKRRWADPLFRKKMKTANELSRDTRSASAKVGWAKRRGKNAGGEN